MRSTEQECTDSRFYEKLKIMKNTILLLLLTCSFFSCQNEITEAEKSDLGTLPPTAQNQKADTEQIPDSYKSTSK